MLPNEGLDQIEKQLSPMSYTRLHFERMTNAQRFEAVVQSYDYIVSRQGRPTSVVAHRMVCVG